MLENKYDMGFTLVFCDGVGCPTQQLQVEGNDGTPTFDQIRAAMADNGWVSRKENGEWHHYCPACHD